MEEVLDLFKPITEGSLFLGHWIFGHRVLVSTHALRLVRKREVDLNAIVADNREVFGDGKGILPCTIIILPLFLQRIDRLPTDLVRFLVASDESHPHLPLRGKIRIAFLFYTLLSSHH